MLPSYKLSIVSTIHAGFNARYAKPIRTLTVTNHKDECASEVRFSSIDGTLRKCRLLPDSRLEHRPPAEPVGQLIGLQHRTPQPVPVQHWCGLSQLVHHRRTFVKNCSSAFDPAESQPKQCGSLTHGSDCPSSQNQPRYAGGQQLLRPHVAHFNVTKF